MLLVPPGLFPSGMTCSAWTRSSRRRNSCILLVSLFVIIVGSSIGNNPTDSHVLHVAGLMTPIATVRSSSRANTNTNVCGRRTTPAASSLSSAWRYCNYYGNANGGSTIRTTAMMGRRSIATATTTISVQLSNTNDDTTDGDENANAEEEEEEDTVAAGSLWEKVNQFLDTPIVDANNRTNQGPVQEVLKEFVRDEPELAQLTFSLVVVAILFLLTKVLTSF